MTEATDDIFDGIAPAAPAPAPVIDLARFRRIDISNTEFLKGIFGSKWGSAHICGFAEDPYDLDRLGLRHYWAGGEASRLLPRFTRAMNQYFTISQFRPDPSGRQRRKKELHEATYCIVVDDVGGGRSPGTASTAKVPWDAIKLRPSWVLETSPDNYQVGYILEIPDVRSGKATALLDAMVAKGLAAGGKDPGMKGVTRYVRLPEGMNRKAKYAGLPGGGFQSVMAWWAPNVRVTVEQVADAYDVRRELDMAPDLLRSSGTGAGSRVQSAGDDLWLDVLSRAGMVKHQLSSGVWDIECPFLDEHTGRADSGAAYLLNGFFKCHHGHCESKPSTEFQDRIRADFPEEFEAARRHDLDRSFGDLGGSRDPFADMRMSPAEQREALGPSSAVAATKPEDALSPGGKFARAFAGSSAADPAAKPMQTSLWLLKNLFPQEGIGVSYGGPKTGKTFVTLGMAASIACGLDWYGHKCKRPGLVVYVSSEGGAPMAWNRVRAWAVKWGNHPGLENLLVYPGTVMMGRGVEDDARALVGWVREEASRRSVPIALVVIDTLNRNMAGDENSTEDMTGFIQVLDKVRIALGTYVHVVHHSGKDTARGARGASALTAAVDAEIEITMDKDPANPSPGVGGIALRNLRHAEDGRSYGFKLEWVDFFEQDEDGEALGSLVAVGAAPPRKPVKLGAWERALMDVLREIVAGDPDKTVDESDLLQEFETRVSAGQFDGLKARKRSLNKAVVDSAASKGVLLRKDGGQVALA